MQSQYKIRIYIEYVQCVERNLRSLVPLTVLSLCAALFYENLLRNYYAPLANITDKLYIVGGC